MRHNSLLKAVLIATLAVFLTGCSRNPVAPITGTQAAPGAGSSAIGVVNDDPPPGNDGGTPNTRTVSLTATDEGVVVVGRWTLYVRKGTLTMPATITMSVTDPEAMEVHFQVSPPEANAFKQSAILTANLSDVGGVDYSNETIFRWNGAWLELTSVSAHQNQQNVDVHIVNLTDCMVGPSTGGHKGKIGF